ncbi:MAG TPA: hypothetical protein VF621_09015, partial [Pyrinomonadaceae bacterium]
MTTATHSTISRGRLARAAALGLLALAATLLQSPEARAQWTTSGTNTTTTNNVGVGTAAPEQPLHVNGISEILSTGSGAGFKFRDRGSASNSNDWVWYSQGNVARFWRAGTGDLLGFTTDGKLGLGTISPAARLDVNGAANIWGGSRFAVPQGYMAVGSLTVGNASANFGGGSGWNANTAGLMLEAADNTEIVVHDAGTRLASLMYFEGGAANRMTIGRDMGFGPVGTVSLNGKVGIGTNAPTHLLDVQGSTGAAFRVRDAAGQEYFSTNSRTGPYGTTPVVSLAGSRLIVEHNGPDGDNHTVIRRLVNGVIFNPSEHPHLPGAFMVRQVGGYYGLFVDQNTNGNVGVGTHAPATKLHVAGDIRVDGNINAKYQDVAEWVPSAQKLTAGTVVILDPERTNHVLASKGSYDTAVAGVISEKPGLSLGDAGEGKVLVATTGRVKVRVDATRAPIKIGDLIVT